MTRTRLDGIGALLAWSAVVLQFVLMVMNRQAAVPETLIRFFSYFTILTNTLVALYFSARLADGRNFLTRPGALTAITAFILIVGLVYQFVLRGLWTPTGLQRVVDELLHSVNPFYMLLYYLLFAAPADRRWSAIWPWLLYPVVYFVLVIARGAVSGFYPYPFVDAASLGYGGVLLNFLGLTCFALLLIGLLVLAGRRK